MAVVMAMFCFCGLLSVRAFDVDVRSVTGAVDPSAEEPDDDEIVVDPSALGKATDVLQDLADSIELDEDEDLTEDAGFPWLESMEETLESTMDTAVEAIAAALDWHRPKRSVDASGAEDKKPLLLKGRTCRRKCEKEMKNHLGSTCEQMNERLQRAQEIKEEDLVKSLTHAAGICRKHSKHHLQHCNWRCAGHEL
mmetsp:Transcript_14600/g.25645  ORF Transcript_14600/g.25645 Transcript_14600/m.25645 type:complete len:195 (-) Transcript_14600:94-678(-)